MPEPAELVASVEMFSTLQGAQLNLAGQTVLITAGGTREAIDPVRFIGNHSSGLQGFALARVAAFAGAKVTVVAANVLLTPPAGVQVVPVVSAAEMAEEVFGRVSDADLIVCAAAVADFAPTQVVESKIKRVGGEGLGIELSPTVDVLAGVLNRRRGDQVVVGFAAETAAEDAATQWITSPFVGTFYAAPSPGSPNFVKVGQTITPGTVLCIVEAMKLMNEIESEVAGVIVEIAGANGKPVEYGDKLFKIKVA
jgi:phosphopantothenoylcysteine synthetase/decarboxylase